MVLSSHQRAKLLIGWSRGCGFESHPWLLCISANSAF